MKNDVFDISGMILIMLSKLLKSNSSVSVVIFTVITDHSGEQLRKNKCVKIYLYGDANV